ncbi:MULTISPECIES: MFS transporter [Acinetobacter]|jgi:MFS family permease|uniref:MFS transporter n=1 Tax=Acinetobacter johnsonii TaxID=40214 RepID=A0AAW6RQI9_ACIJO|nr:MULTISPECIES: MFS transporter [Acinetobacter]MBB4810890.1 MFS family permease [Acinetobacter johnsonii]MBO7705429.1 MFS transporter [Acinetobacter sp.]MCV2450406.1 MFS transporter [Acinetobacter johnsonii]MDG9785908.1 MFS transporter [Acinetobacter johnsonii]MDG9797833.1 MFS transporter [Acinetobacter johnsonii]
MKNNEHLLSTRRFLPMFITQFFGALNDNVYKQALLLVITYGWINQQAADVSTLNNLAALLFILPYFIFSATAGQIADKFERSQLIRGIKVLEIVIMLIGSAGFLLGNLWLLLLALFMMGTHSTFFGPIKYAILPEILKPNELMSGNALFQSGTSIAILIGMILGGAVISVSQGNLIWISLTVVIIAILGYLSSRFILKQQVSSPDLKIDWNFFRTSFQTLKYAKSLPLIFMILLGNSWYWFYGATYLTQIPQLTQQNLHASENVVSLLLTFFSVGIGVGSLLCRRIGGSEVNIKMVPIGAIGLTLFAFYLALSLAFVPERTGAMMNVADMFNHGAIYYHVMLAVTLLGISGGFYIVPLYAMMQAYSPRSHRARVVAANNILNAVFMVSSAIFSIIILSVLKIDIKILFSITAVLSAGFTLWLLYRLKPMLKTVQPELED